MIKGIASARFFFTTLLPVAILIVWPGISESAARAGPNTEVPEGSDSRIIVAGATTTERRASASQCRGLRLIKRANSRIIGGTEANIADWPGLVAIRVNNGKQGGDSRSEYFCGGTLISERWVLTAAHCLSTYDAQGRFEQRSGRFYRSFTAAGMQRHGFEGKGQLQVVAGADNLSNVDEALVRNVERAEIHPGYKDPTKHTGSDFPDRTGHDLALLMLDKPLPSDLTARLSLSYETDPPDEFRVPAMVAGFGRTEKDPPLDAIPESKGFSVYTRAHPSFLAGTDKLLEADVPTLRTSTCRQLLRKVSGFTDDFVVGDGQICAMDPQARRDTCNADSGGPLVVFDKNKCPYLVGLTSWGSPSCQAKNYPAVYSRVSNYASWITEIAGEVHAVDTTDISVTRSEIERGMREWQRTLDRVEPRLVSQRGRLKLGVCKLDGTQCSYDAETVVLGGYSNALVRLESKVTGDSRLLIFLVSPSGIAQLLYSGSAALDGPLEVKQSAGQLGTLPFEGGALLALAMPADAAAPLEAIVSRSPNRVVFEFPREFERALGPLSFESRSSNERSGWGYARSTVQVSDDY